MIGSGIQSNEAQESPQHMRVGNEGRECKFAQTDDSYNLERAQVS